eukprot:5329345-Amphidinium_carterae.1
MNKLAFQGSSVLDKRSTRMSFFDVVLQTIPENQHILLNVHGPSPRTKLQDKKGYKQVVFR